MDVIILVQGNPDITPTAQSGRKRFICTSKCFTVFETNECYDNPECYCSRCPTCFAECCVTKVYYDRLQGEQG